jgi:Autographiviridae endonuclease VII
VARRSKLERDGRTKRNNKIDSKTRSKSKSSRNGTAPVRKYRDAQHRQTALARRRQLEKERYWADPDYRRRKVDEKSRYRAANAEALNARQRQRYQTDPDFRRKLRARNRRDGWLRQLRKCGISEEEHGAMLRRQRGRCGICKRKPGKRRLCVDHDHKTGRVRGLLCHKCNSGIGFYGDDARLTRAATAYLEAAYVDALPQPAARRGRARPGAGSPAPASPARRKRTRSSGRSSAAVAHPARRARAGRARRVRRTVSPFGPRPDSKKGPGRGHHRGRVTAVCEPTGEFLRGSRQRA